MNRQRFRYIFFSLVFLVIALVLAFGLTESDPFWLEIAILAAIVLVLSHFVGRDSGKEDESSGIVSMEDDD